MDTEFYAIAAQVIPTLLIAIALEGGIRSRHLIGDIILGFIGGLSLVAEFVCIDVLMHEARPTEAWEGVVKWGMSTLFILAVAPLIIHGVLRRRGS